MSPSCAGKLRSENPASCRTTARRSRTRKNMSRTGQIFGLSLALAAPLGAGAEEIVTVSGRPGATQSYLLLHYASPPEAVAVLFPGGEGLLSLRVEGDAVKFRGRENFLVRTRT